MAVCDVADELFRNKDGVRILDDGQIQEFGRQLREIEEDTSLGVLERAKAVSDLREGLEQLKVSETTKQMEDAITELDILMSFAEADKAGIGREEVLLGLLDKSNTTLKGGRDSATRRRNTMLTEKQAFLNRAIEQHGLSKHLDGANDVDIANAVDYMTSGMNDADILAKGVQEKSLLAGKILRDVMDMAHDDLIKGGFSVAKREGYLGKQVYDSDKIKADFEGFKGALRRNIDWDSTAKDLKADMLSGRNTPDTDAFFNKLYDSEVAGTTIGGGVYNIGRQRNIKFKSGANWVEVLKDYGRGETLYANVISAYESTAKKVGLAEKLGSNPRKTLDKMLKKVPSNKHKLINNMFEVYQGRTPAKGWYKYAEDTRNWASTAMLGGSIFTALKSDPIALSHALKASGFVDNIVEGYVKNFTTYIKNLHPTVRKETAKSIVDKFYADSHALTRYLADSPDGKSAQALNLLLKMNGLTQHTAIQATSAIEIMASSLKRQVKEGTINPQTIKYLGTHGIDDIRLEAIKLLPEDAPFTAQALRDIDISSLKDRLPKNMDEARFKEDTLKKLSGAFEDMGFAATNTPTLRDKVTLEGNLDSNSISGQGWKFATQYMSTVWRGGADMQFHSRLQGGGKLGIASMVGQKMVGAVALATFINYLQDWAYDRVPEEQEFTSESFFRAMGTSGIFGVYGDTIVGALAWEQGSFSDIGGAPAVSLYGKGLDTIRSKVQGGDLNFSENDVKKIIKMVPFNKLPYLYRPTQAIAEIIGD